MHPDTLNRLKDGRTDLVLDLLAAGLTAATTDHNGVSLIQWCAYYGDVSAIRLLLSHGESLTSLGPNFDLNGAAFHGHWQLRQFLIENGARANHPLPDTGETPLHAALCRANDPAAPLVVEVLLAAGANPNAATLDNAPTSSFMRDCRTKAETPLHRAAAFGTEAAIDQLIAAGAYLEARDSRGDTPLSWASWHLRPDAILRKLCHAPHTIHPARNSTSDHGQGTTAMQRNLLGKPHPPRTEPA